MVFWPSGLLEAWGAKAKKPSLPENVWFLGLGAPGLKNTWPTKTLRGLFELGFLVHGFRADRRSSILEVQPAPIGQTSLSTGGPRSGPTVGWGSCPVGAGWARKVDDSPSAQKSCSKNSSV